MPARDAALRHLAATATYATFAWRPDGQVLATVASLAARNGGAHASVALYDCATGKPLATLTPQSPRAAATHSLPR